MRIPLGSSSFERSVAQSPNVRLVNRYFEADPTNQADQVALLSRPALRRWLTMGDGPIRAVYSQPGAFDSALFTVSGSDLFKVARDETITDIGSVAGGALTSFVSMAATDEHLFIADGGVLSLYIEDGYARSTLTGTPANNDTITLGTIYYKWTNGSVDASSPAGTSGNPWLVALGANATEAFSNMAKAIGDTGTPGTTYSTALTAHTQVTATDSGASTLKVRAIATGTAGNSIATTETGAALAWSDTTLEDGGTAGLFQVLTPDDVGIVSVGHISGFIICVVAQGFGMNGRFYWIEPGETTIDPLNFATAERAPDPCWTVRVVGDQFWLPGTNTNEVWYPTGNPDAPFLRVQGRLFDRGIWEGTDVQIKEQVVLVDTDGVVYAVGSAPVKISNNSIEQRIREAMIEQTTFET